MDDGQWTWRVYENNVAGVLNSLKTIFTNKDAFAISQNIEMHILTS